LENPDSIKPNSDKNPEKVMINQYLIIPLTIILGIFYLLSYIFSRLKIIKFNTHRKIWNVLLLITFFVTAILGIILVIQVNYKLEIPAIDKILIWHVNFGISMAIIVIFHFSLHFKYFKDIVRQLTKKRKVIPYNQEKSANYDLFPEKNEKIQIKIDNYHKWPIMAMGISAVITQIILLREFLSVFFGNELVIGIIFANWMILTGAGSYLGKFSYRIKNYYQFIIGSLILIAVLPLITVFLLNLLRNIIFPVGSMISVIQILFSSLVLLSPFCLLSGFLFTLFSHTLSRKFEKNLISKVYSYEALGSILGGVLFNFILIYFLKTFQSLLVLMIIDLFIAFVLTYKWKTIFARLLAVVLSCIFLFLTIYFNLDNVSRKFLFKEQELLFHKDTPYGNLVITKTGDQVNFYENNVLLFTTHNTTANEEAVHYAMVQHPDPQNVLLISGGISGTTTEILKYKVKNIDYVEINPWLIEIGENFTSALTDKKINVINQDARLFIKKTSNFYNVVLINLPEPVTAQINRYYTLEFFKELKKILTSDGLISLSLMSTADYVSEEANMVNSVIYNTLKTVFENIIIIPGENNYFLASDRKLNINIAHLIEERGIENVYVNRYYLDDQLLAERSRYILQNMEQDTQLNKDFSPVSYYWQIRYWLSYFETSYWILAGISLILIIYIISRLNPISLGLFSGGFAASSIELLLLISFQIIYGYVYQMIGIIITIFMGGLAIGSLYRHKIIPNVHINNYFSIQFGIGIYSILLPFILILLKSVNIYPYIIHFIFFSLTFIIALLIGIEFSLASKLQSRRISTIAAELYSVDLLGSAIGALLVTAFLIPILGIIKVCIIIGLLNFGSGLVTFIKRKNYLE